MPDIDIIISADSGVILGIEHIIGYDGFSGNLPVSYNTQISEGFFCVDTDSISNKDSNVIRIAVPITLSVEKNNFKVFWGISDDPIFESYSIKPLSFLLDSQQNLVGFGLADAGKEIAKLAGTY